MRHILYVGAGLTALAMTTTANAGTCSGSETDCDGDGVPNTTDLCPFDADGSNAANTTVFYAGTTDPLPTGAACTASTAEVDPTATLGFGVSLYDGARVF